MEKKNKWRCGLPLMCLLVTAVLMVTACPPPPEPWIESIVPEDKTQGPVLGIGFTKAPELTFTGDWVGSSTGDKGKIQYSFTPAVPDTDLTYTVYIAEGTYNKSADVIKKSSKQYSGSPDTPKEVQLSKNAGVWFSAVVVAQKADGSSQAISAVVQSAVNSGYAEIEQAAGDTLISRGKATAPGAKTYYIDYENGDDDVNDGTSAMTAWQTFKNVNDIKRVFRPGDHILLNADSIWNGTPVTKDNYRELSAARGNDGMLWPKGNGTADKPIVIDLYRHENYGQNTMKVIYSAKQRPIINGNGTPSTDASGPYGGSGAIHSQEGQNYWHIRNIEATNSFENFADPAIRAKHWYTRPGTKYNSGGNGPGAYKALYGIYWRSDVTSVPVKGLLIENCYLHDIQSFHSNNRDDSDDWTSNTYFGFAASKPGKAGGGIAVAMTESTIKGNIIRRTGYMGLRTYTSSDYMSKKNNFIGNYIDTVFGDGLVISSTRGSPTEWSLIENNIFKNMCAAPNHGVGNFAACWAMNSRYTLFQYNEAYGTLYGYNDGEAWDIDIDSNQTIYQYNYSHHNAGGSLLIMGTANGVYRYNVSANDGLSSRGLYNILKDDPADAPKISTSANSYTAWQNGQCIFHYTYTGTTANNNVPLIYNNTFYIGPNVPSVGVVGHNAGQVNKYVRFYNNIILKAGPGTVHLSYGQQGSGNTDGYIFNPSTGFKNNLLWAYRDDPAVGDMAGIKNGTDANAMSMQNLTSNYGNKWANPRLKIQEAGMTNVLRNQLDTVFVETKTNNDDPAKLADFVSTGRIRARASLFMPVDQAAADALKFGMVIPGSVNSTIDNAWNDSFVTMDKSGTELLDFFGDPITSPPAVGASNGVFDSSKYNPAQ